MSGPGFFRKGLVLTLLLGLSQAIAACPVCYGGADNEMIDGVQAGVYLLLAILTCVLGGFVALFLRFRHLAMKVAEAEAAEVLSNQGGVL